MEEEVKVMTANLQSCTCARSSVPEVAIMVLERAFASGRERERAAGVS